ncbi:hypothetical protein AWB65_06355 [Caballeronia humi]|uniref:Uncharacterized protein n=1 Tax=Caballeronia humi TaxID=326474 RepID=A0A158JC72_9BURK|nr:hypothetical protein AWB65_06355 [Caballeronia humi]
MRGMARAAVLLGRRRAHPFHTTKMDSRVQRLRAATTPCTNHVAQGAKFRKRWEAAYGKFTVGSGRAGLRGNHFRMRRQLTVCELTLLCLRSTVRSWRSDERYSKLQQAGSARAKRVRAVLHPTEKQTLTAHTGPRRMIEVIKHSTEPLARTRLNATPWRFARMRGAAPAASMIELCRLSQADREKLARGIKNENQRVATNRYGACLPFPDADGRRRYAGTDWSWSAKHDPGWALSTCRE